jgi:salicylate hydroxylase
MPPTQCYHICPKVILIRYSSFQSLTVIQGAAMAVEDGAGLAEILSKISSRDQISTAMKVFEKERIKRTSQMLQASAINGKLWHFKDGPEQEARDTAMRPEVEGRPFLESPNQWSDPLTAVW